MMRNMGLSISVLVGLLAGMAMPNDGRSEGFLGGATGSVDKARQELQKLGAEAAQHAKKAEQAAQEAEQLANTLSGNAKGNAKDDAQQAAQDARQKASQAKAKADEIQGQASQGDGGGNLDDLRQATQDVKQMGAEAQGHAKRARDVAGSSSESRMKNSDTGLTISTDEPQSMDSDRSASPRRQRGLLNPTSPDADTGTGLQKSTD